MNQAQDDPDHARRTAQLLDGVELGPRRVLVVTDAELAVIDGSDAGRFGPLLTLGRDVDDATRNSTIDEAARRMSGTGATADGTRLGHDGDAEPTVRTVLRMRRSWAAAVLIDQHTAGSHEWVAAYLRADGRALTEIATREGHHTLAVLTRAAALDAIAEILTPRASTRGADGPERAVPIDALPHMIEHELGTATVVSSAVVKRVDRVTHTFQDERFAVYSLPERTEHLVHTASGVARLTQVSRPTVRARLDAMTRAA